MRIDRKRNQPSTMLYPISPTKYSRIESLNEENKDRCNELHAGGILPDEPVKIIKIVKPNLRKR